MPFLAHRPYPLPSGENPLAGPVRRRHVLFIQGFFPEGPAYYHKLLKKQLQHHARLYALDVTCSELTQIAPLVRRCEIETSAGGQGVRTVYDFLDWSDVVEKAHSRSWLHTAARATLTFAYHFIDGTFFAMLRLFWKFALAWILPYVIFLLIGVCGLLALQYATEISSETMLMPLVKTAVSILIALMLWQISRINWCASMLRSFNYASLYAKGGAPELDRRLEDFASIIAGTCKTSDADEILIVAHSFGGQLAARAVAGALRQGAFENNNNRTKLLTVGDAGMHVALMKGPSAAAVRQAVFEISAQQDMPWVVIYSGKDAMSFNNVDPPSSLKEFEGHKSRVEDFAQPLMYDARLRSMMSEKDYRQMRWRFFHLHGLFIMAARLKTAHFDYLRAVCGAVPLALSAKRISAK